MSARAVLLSVDPLEKSGKLTDTINLKVAFEVYEYLPDEIEFEIVVAWDGDRKNDQILDSIEVGPVKAGKHQFVLDVAKLPDYSRVKDEDVTDICVLFLYCSYRGSRFASVSFYVQHDYEDEELIKDPPAKPQLDKLIRTISTDDFRVTTFPIKWTDNDSLMPPDDEQPDENDEDGDKLDLDTPIAL